MTQKLFVNLLQFATVYKARDVVRDRIVAVKKVTCSIITSST